MSRVSFVVVVLCLVATSIAEEAAAYPQYIAKGYTNCVTCHYSPTGGGLANAYGLATLKPTIPDELYVKAISDLREWFPKGEVTGVDDDGRPAFQWDAGFDGRLLFLGTPTEVGGDNTTLVIPMLAEAGVILGYGPWLAYGTMTSRKNFTEERSMFPFSREHWLRFNFSDSLSLRAGRMLLPFGLRIADHTQYILEDFGLGKWGQSYGMELDGYSEGSMWSLALSAGDLVGIPEHLQERAITGSYALNFPSLASIGVSGFFGHGELLNRAALAVFARTRIYNGIYAMGELAGLQAWQTTADQSQTTALSYVRAGWFLLESLDLYTEFGARGTSGASVLTKLRYGFGADWQLLPWIELSPQVLLEESEETGLVTTVFGQLHVIY